MSSEGNVVSFSTRMMNQQQSLPAVEGIGDNCSTTVLPLLQQQQLQESKQAEALYDACYREGIPSTDVHSAVIESHRWHQRWRQDALGLDHNMIQPPLTRNLSEDGSDLYHSIKKKVLSQDDANNTIPSSKRSAIIASTNATTSRFQRSLPKYKRQTIRQYSSSTTSTKPSPSATSSVLKPKIGTSSTTSKNFLNRDEEETLQPRHSKRPHRVSFATQEQEPQNRHQRIPSSKSSEETDETVIRPNPIRPKYPNVSHSYFDLRPRWCKPQGNHHHPAGPGKRYKNPLPDIVPLQGAISPLELPPPRCSRPSPKEIDPLELQLPPRCSRPSPQDISPSELQLPRCSRPIPQDISPLQLQPPQMTSTFVETGTAPPALVELDDDDIIYERSKHRTSYYRTCSTTTSSSEEDYNIQTEQHNGNVARNIPRKQIEERSLRSTATAAYHQSLPYLPRPYTSSSLLYSNRLKTIPSDDGLKSNFLHALSISSGDVDNPVVRKALIPLVEMFQHHRKNATMMQQQYHSTSRGVNIPSASSCNGMWLTLSKPTYSGHLGPNQDGDPQYTLGRMAFDMFRPTKLVCSLQGIFNHVEQVSPHHHHDGSSANRPAIVTPKGLEEAVNRDSWESLKTYNLMTAFTIEPYHPDFPSNSPNVDICRPIRGIMTTYGYIVPDPNVPDRFTVWFTGGKIEPNTTQQDIQNWRKVFASPAERTLKEKAACFVAQMLMGATIPTHMNLEENSSLTYEFTRPIGGHGLAYVDLIYMDDGLRVMRGHKGTIFVFARVPDPNHLKT